MRRLAAIVCLVAASARPAVAASLSLGFSAGFAGGGGVHERHSGMFGGGFFGLDHVEAAQARFEDRFADLTATYDDGLAEIEDYYASDDYFDVVDDAQRLVDRYDWFLTGIERTIDHLGDFIESANDRLTFLQELLTDYQARDNLSETRLARIEDWLTGLQDHVQLKIDLLTEQQTTLTENLPTYQEFQTELTTFYDDIVAAGGGTSSDDDDGGSAAALRALSAVSTDAGCAVMPELDSGSVPEPHSLVLAGLAATAIHGVRRHRRRAGLFAVYPTCAAVR